MLKADLALTEYLLSYLSSETIIAGKTQTQARHSATTQDPSFVMT